MATRQLFWPAVGNDSCRSEICRCRLERQREMGISMFYKAPSMPKNLSDFESYGLVFADEQLQKFWGISRTF